MKLPEPHSVLMEASRFSLECQTDLQSKDLPMFIEYITPELFIVSDKITSKDLHCFVLLGHFAFSEQPDIFLFKVTIQILKGAFVSLKSLEITTKESIAFIQRQEKLIDASSKE